MDAVGRTWIQQKRIKSVFVMNQHEYMIRIASSQTMEPIVLQIIFVFTSSREQSVYVCAVWEVKTHPSFQFWNNLTDQLPVVSITAVLMTYVQLKHLYKQNTALYYELGL